MKRDALNECADQQRRDGSSGFKSHTHTPAHAHAQSRVVRSRGGRNGSFEVEGNKGEKVIQLTACPESADAQVDRATCSRIHCGIQLKATADAWQLGSTDGWRDEESSPK